jgi:hypothetical protein
VPDSVRKMPAELLLTSRSGASPGPVAVPSGASESISVPAGVLAWHAMYTGGPLPEASSPLSRLIYRAANEAILWACLEPAAGLWIATELYHRIETSEKAQASYRLGMIGAGVAGELALGLPLLVHRETLFGKSTGKRGDLLGYRPATGDWHGIEAKGKSPQGPVGATRDVSPSDFDHAKDQAQSLALDLSAAVLLTGSGDHWAVTTLASTIGPLELVLDDPGVGVAGDPPLPPERDFAQEDPFERLLQGYYQVVGDIEAVIASNAEPVAGSSVFADDYVGVPLPGTSLWIGARRELFTARREERLREVVDEVARDEHQADDMRHAVIGLAIERVTPARAT